MKLIFRLVCYYIPVLRPLLSCPMELSIIRHAQSERNAFTNNFQKGSDDSGYVGPPEKRELMNLPDHRVNLTEEGHKQAEVSGPGITAEITPDIIFLSGYTRTEQTLSGIKRGSSAWDKVPIKVDLLIRERETGYTWVLVDQPHREVFPFLPTYWDQHGHFFSRPVGGESILDLIEKRLCRFLDKVSKKHSGKKICLVTHGRVKTGLRVILEDLTIEEAEGILGRRSFEDGPKNVGLTVYRYSPWSGRLELVFYNKTFY